MVIIWEKKTQSVKTKHNVPTVTVGTRGKDFYIQETFTKIRSIIMYKRNLSFKNAFEVADVLLTDTDDMVQKGYAIDVEITDYHK